jgi:hypothetical protein
MFQRLLTLLRSPVFWLLAGVFVLEFVLFDQFGARRHTPVYPRWNDQIQYLTESYSGFEFARSRGAAAGLLNALTNPSAQGTLHDFGAIAIFLIAGPSRSAALSLNILALIGWQLALFCAISRSSESRALGFASALLPLALLGPWDNVPGSAYDFRLDHLAMCGLGITAALAIQTDRFQSRAGVTRFGVAMGLTLLTRFLTGTYFFVVFVGLAVWLLWEKSERKLRGVQLVRAGIIATVIAGPIFWLNYDTVREYYWIGHYVGPESAIRDPNFGVVRSVKFVFGELGRRHLGPAFGLIAAAGVVALALLRRGERAPLRRDPWFIGGLFLFACATVLILHRQKSEVVVSALAAGAVTLVAAAWMTAGRRASPRQQLIFAAAASVVILTLFARAQLRPAYTPGMLAEIRQVNTMADRVFNRARAANLKELRVGVDYITDALDAQVLRVICYERHRVLVPVNMTLPTSIAEPTDAVVMSRLNESDFVFVTEEGGPGPFPYDRKLTALRPQVRAWCDANLRPAERFTIFGRRMVLYQRREIPFP